MSIPIINVDPLIRRTAGEEHVAKEIRHACCEAGFFYIVGHGVAMTQQQALEDAAKQFFALESEVKERIAMSLGGIAWRGYFKVGDELTSGKPDLKEGLYFGTELSAEHPRVKQNVPMHGPNLFPDEVPALKEAVLDYMSALTSLGRALMRGISMSLGLSPDYFKTNFTGNPLTLFRIFRYPPSSPGQFDQWGVGEHTDYGLLTILRQDEVGGLQVKSKAGWIDAPPVADAFVCNIGDMLDRITQGFYRSTPHRVQNTSGRERFSFPFFFDPDFDAPIIPVTSPLIEQREDDAATRWDKSSVHAFDGTYGEYLLQKVGKVFPDLKDSVIR